MLKLWQAAANGGVRNGGLRGVWPPFLEIGRNRPFSPFFCLFRPSPEGAKSTLEIQKTEEKGLFPQISSDLLRPLSLKPPFAALQRVWQEQHVAPPEDPGGIVLDCRSFPDKLFPKRICDSHRLVLRCPLLVPLPCSLNLLPESFPKIPTNEESPNGGSQMGA